MLLAAIQQLQQALTANGLTINPVSWTIKQNLHGVSVHFDWLDPLTGLFSVNIAGVDHGESHILNKINFVKKSPSRQKRDRKRWNNHMMKIKNQIAEEPLSTKLEDKADKEKNTHEHSTVPSCPSSDQMGMLNLNPQAAEFKPHMQQTVEKDVVCNPCPLLQELPFNDHPNISLEVDILDTIKTDLGKTKAKLQSTINECSEKRRHVKDLCGSIFRLKSDIQDYKEKCDILKQKHDKVQSENSTLRSQNHILEVDKSSLKSMLGDVQMDNANIKTENISLKSRCSFLQSKQQNVHQRTAMPSMRYSTWNWDFNDRTFYQWQYLKQGWQ